MNYREIANVASEAWATAPEELKPVLQQCCNALLAAADEIDGLDDGKLKKRYRHAREEIERLGNLVSLKTLQEQGRCGELIQIKMPDGCLYIAGPQRISSHRVTGRGE